MRSPKNFYIVRWAKPEDYRQLLRLAAQEASIIYGKDSSRALDEYLSLYGPEPYMSRAGIRRSIAEYRRGDPHEYIIVAEKSSDRKIIGFIHGRVYRNVAYLNDIVIDLSEGGRGLGSLLLYAFEDAVRTTHPEVRRIETDTHAGALRFFQRHGYSVKWEDVGRDGIVWYRLVKMLSDE